MSLFKEFQSRQIQKKANNFIKSLENKSEKEVGSILCIKTLPSTSSYKAK